MVFATVTCAMLHKTAASAISVYCTAVGALFNSYTMATWDLPDIYAQARGPQARGRGHIYQANPEWPWYK